MYSDAFPAVSPYAAGKLKFLFFEGKDKQTKAIPKKTAGKASKKTEARQSTVLLVRIDLKKHQLEANLNYKILHTIVSVNRSKQTPIRS